MSTSVRRVFSASEKAIYHRMRQSLSFWTAQHRKQTVFDPYLAFRVCALHKALNILRGKPNCHVITKCTNGYTEAMANVMAERLINDAKLDVDAPLRCYVVISTVGMKPDKLPRTGQLHVQAAHALCELMKHYGRHPDVTRWADVDQTLVVCAPTGYQKLPRMEFGGVYCPYGTQVPYVSFTDSHYGEPLAFALYPMTERQAQVLGLTVHPLL